MGIGAEEKRGSGMLDSRARIPSVTIYYVLSTPTVYNILPYKRFGPLIEI